MNRRNFVKNLLASVAITGAGLRVASAEIDCEPSKTAELVLEIDTASFDQDCKDWLSAPELHVIPSDKYVAVLGEPTSFIDGKWVENGLATSSQLTDDERRVVEEFDAHGATIRSRLMKVNAAT